MSRVIELVSAELRLMPLTRPTSAGEIVSAELRLMPLTRPTSAGTRCSTCFCYVCQNGIYQMQGIHKGDRLAPGSLRQDVLHR